MNANQTLRAAFRFLYSELRASHEQTEAYLFATAELRAIPAHAVNEAIGQLVAKRIIRETTIKTPEFGDIDALVMV